MTTIETTRVQEITVDSARETTVTTEMETETAADSAREGRRAARDSSVPTEMERVPQDLQDRMTDPGL